MNSKISFFKHHSLDEFRANKNPDKWKRVNTYYRWQLLRWNTNYKQTINRILRSQDSNFDLHIKEAGNWGISELVHYQEQNPPSDFHFLHSSELNYINLGEISTKELEVISRSKGKSKKILRDTADNLFYLTDSSTNFKTKDQRILVIAIDLKSNFSESNKRKFIKVIKAKMNSYKEKHKQPSYKELKTPSSILDFEKNIITYEYYIRNKKSLIGLRDHLQKELGLKARYDISTYRRKLSAVTRHVEQVKYVITEINKP